MTPEKTERLIPYDSKLEIDFLCSGRRRLKKLRNTVMLLELSLD
jgi:hypothetical protein